MLPIVLVSVFLAAAAMAAPTTQVPIETLRSLVNPSPELISTLNEVRATINATSSLAAATPETSMGRESANLNLMSGLNDIILGFLRGILDKMLTPGRSSPSGNDIFGSPSGGGARNPVEPAYPAARRGRRFNPFKISNSNPFGMFYPSMMFEFMDGIF